MAAPKKPAAAAKKATPRAAKSVKASASSAPVDSQKPAKPIPGAKVQSITPKVERFILEYLASLNGTQAYIRSHPGVSEATARVEAARLLANPRVKARVAAEGQKTAKKLEITREKMAARLWSIFTADPRELMEYRVTCCRRCFGIGGAYQWVDEAEFSSACERAAAEYEKALRSKKAGEPAPRLVLPSDAGGYGFDATLGPSDDCEGCAGQGVGRTVFKDTRFLSPEAAALFAGVKETKEGLQFLTHSQLDAAEKLAKHLGFYEKDNEQSGGGIAKMVAAFASGLHARSAGALPMRPPKTNEGGGQ